MVMGLVVSSLEADSLWEKQAINFAPSTMVLTLMFKMPKLE
jgi:hypothetical protein